MFFVKIIIIQIWDILYPKNLKTNNRYMRYIDTYGVIWRVHSKVEPILWNERLGWGLFDFGNGLERLRRQSL